MVTNPHDTCAQILNTLRISGLTYTLNETPYSVYLTLRKKVLKEYTPQPLATGHDTQKHLIYQKTDKTSDYQNTISKLQEALTNEITNHNATKNELSHTETEAEKLVDYINDLNNIKKHQTSVFYDLQAEHAEEADDHAKSERALQQLELSLKTFSSSLKKR